jgi:hypothetical protein
MVNPKDIPAAKSILAELGYQQITVTSTWDHSFHEIPYYKIVNFPVFIELHWELDDSKMIAFPAKQIWNRTQVLQLQGGSTTVLSPEDNLLFLACHLFKHDDQLLKFLADIAELLKKYDGLLDWDYITESIHSWQIETYAYYSLKLAGELLGAPVPVSTLETLKPGLWRRCTLGLLLDNEFFISPDMKGRFRSWTLVLAWSLMSKHLHQTRNVLLKHEGARKRVAWPKISVWIMLVLAAALGRYLMKPTKGRINSGLPCSINNASG